MSLNGTNMILEGEPINIQYVLSVDRIIQTEEDMAIVEAMEANNPDAFKQYKKPEYGDFLYKDVDGDGCITDNDKIKVGKVLTRHSLLDSISVPTGKVGILAVSCKVLPD